ADLAAARDAVATATDARREAAAELATWTARRDALALSLTAQDATAELADAGLPGILGPLAGSVTVTPGWENALAALLGELAGAAVVADADAAVAALTHARQADSGRLRLVIANGPDAAAPTAAAPAGTQAAAQLITADSQALHRALAGLLEGAWVTADLEGARAVREVLPEAVVATRDGDVLAPAWATGAGEAGSSVLALAAAHEEAVAQAEAAAAAETGADADLASARAAESAARAAVAEALEHLRAADAAAARVAEELARLNSAARAAEEETGRARRVLERAESETAQRAAELASAQAALAEVESTPLSAPGGGSAAEASTDAEADIDTAIDAARSEREQTAAAARTARAAETEARLRLRTAEERESNGRGRAGSLRAAARREREQRAAAERAEALRAQRMTTAAQVRDQARAAADTARTWVEQAQAQRTHIEAERAEASAAAADVRRELDKLTADLAALSDAAYRDEIARAEQNLRLENLAERAMNELGLELDALVEEFGPHMLVPEITEDPEESPDGADGVGAASAADPAQTGTSPQTGRPYVRAEQDKRLARAKRDLARLGKVNPLALEEHAAMEERHRFLAEQLADLKQSRADLLHIVEDIDARVEEVFAEAYADTAREFAVVFDRLFPGGEGRLILTDPDDMLATGIDIEARPAGKKVKRLSLLSGGERSLAAVALLVAIFRARPSPFYVMDEVEAALDDTNLGRLLDIFTELRASSQLIIITHQKRTMEIADALYGITMRDGVTQAVSQRLSHDPQRTG
ncbi:AAA family ATPase, partial [Actinomyces sp. MRS3W]|uniref:AAA family ATPase n=1 Tax=Actinomyces sp. MRS3W TaxID=2800796 RepID=UPI0028FDBB52